LGVNFLVLEGILISWHEMSVVDLMGSKGLPDKGIGGSRIPIRELLGLVVPRKEGGYSLLFGFGFHLDSLSC